MKKTVLFVIGLILVQCVVIFILAGLNMLNQTTLMMLIALTVLLTYGFQLFKK
ncbi:MAG: hypothetical protein OCC45_09715 [Desulfotalea sp.]